MKTSVKSTPITAKNNSAIIDRPLALLLFVFTLAWYARTLPPGLLMGDAGEFQFAAWRFGLAHPTGYPLYLILGGIWQRLLALFSMDPAAALNLFSAVTGAAVIGLVYLLMVHWLPPTGWGRLCALFAALLLAFNPTFWSQSIIAEVYALHALFIVAVLLLSQRLTAEYMRNAGGATLVHPITTSPHHLLLLSGLLGLSFTHHRTSLFLLPGLILLLFWLNRAWWRRGWLLLGAILALILPQLLYSYIPLRSGPTASPWLYPRLDGEVLALYQPGWQGFVDFVAGRVFAVSLLGLHDALARLPQMAELWLIHFQPTGLVLIVIGLIVLIRRRNWPVLLLTLPFATVHQIFNLFYGIGDIFVYYIPLYLVGVLWAGFGVWGAGIVFTRKQFYISEIAGQSTNDNRPGAGNRVGAMQLVVQFALFTAILLFTILPLTRYYAEIDQSGNDVARQMWSAILAADPPADAILISNDRNEVVPLYYLQAVEGIAPEVTGLFPLLTPEQRFADVGAVVQTALSAGERPVYLIKPMAGLSVRYELEPATSPLVRVLGAVSAEAVAYPLAIPYGPLTLLGYDWQLADDAVDLTLYWRVDQPVDANYTTTVQIFNADGERIAQNDQPAGEPYYPTSLWKEGNVLRERHTLSLTDEGAPTQMLIGMYRRVVQPGDATQSKLIYLASPLQGIAVGEGQRTEDSP